MSKQQTRMNRVFLIPHGLVYGLRLLGVVFVVVVPFMLASARSTAWTIYGLALAMGVGYAISYQRRFRVTILSRNHWGMVAWIRRTPPAGEEERVPQLVAPLS